MMTAMEAKCRSRDCCGNCADISIKCSKDARMSKEFKCNESTRIRGKTKKSLFDYLLN
jgi:hypothetical protein